MSRHGNDIGRMGEELAARYLSKAGYEIISRNYREKFGEIDIIARDGSMLVFIEVKTRKSKRFGHPLEAITSHKQHQISKAATAYLSRNGLLDAPARFDVIGIGIDNGEPDVVHLRHAFEAE